MYLEWVQGIEDWTKLKFLDEAHFISRKLTNGTKFFNYLLINLFINLPIMHYLFLKVKFGDYNRKEFIQGINH
jgi:hypothetical protein